MRARQTNDNLGSLTSCTCADDAHVIVGRQASSDNFWTIVEGDSSRGDEFSIGECSWFVTDKKYGAVVNVHLVNDSPLGRVDMRIQESISDEECSPGTCAIIFIRGNLDVPQDTFVSDGWVGMVYVWAVEDHHPIRKKDLGEKSLNMKQGWRRKPKEL